MPGKWFIVCLLCSCVDALSILLGNTSNENQSVFDGAFDTNELRNLTFQKSHVRNLSKSREPYRIAVIISGLQERFLLASKIEQIVGPSKHWEYVVDFYINLLQKNNGQNNFKSPHKIVEPEFKDVVGRSEYAAFLTRKIEASGATVQHVETPSNEEQIELPETKECNKNRLKEKPPCFNKIGQNVLRRYFSIQNLTTIAFQKHQYEFVVVTRDDDHFLGKLDMLRFAVNYDNATNRVFSKDCKTWWGVNDKTLVFGSTAAKKTLLRLYSDFWMPDKRLDGTRNPEQHLKNFFDVTGVISTPVPWAEIPSADSFWVMNKAGKPVLCQRQHYLCDQYPNGNPKYWQKLDQPDWCPDLGIKL